MPKKNIKDAIISTLIRVDKPLSIKEIYNLIIQWDYYRFKAERPEGVVAVEIRRHCVGVDFPSAKPNKFYKLLPDGRYTLLNDSEQSAELGSNPIPDAADNISIGSQLKNDHLAYSRNFKLSVLNDLKKLPAQTFEVFSMGLLSSYGFDEMQVTKFSKDGGIDGFGKLKIGITDLEVAFQSKRWQKASVSAKEVLAFRGAIQGNYAYGIYFTTSTFTRDAKKLSIQSGAVPIILIDGEMIVEIMIERRFGVEVDLLPVYVNALDRALNED